MDTQFRAEAPTVSDEKMRFLTLRFRNPDTERQFNAHALPGELLQGRVAMAVASQVYIGFGLLDLWFAPTELHDDLLWVRLLFLGLSWTIVFLSYVPRLQRYMNVLFAVIGLFAGTGYLVQFMMLDPAVLAYYYPGMMLAAFFTYNFVGTRYIYALVIDVLLVVMFNVVAIKMGLSFEHILTHDFLLICANMIGGSAGYLTERARRKLFVHELALDRARANAETANTAKSRVLASASHDLRQPLQAMDLFLHSLRLKNLDADTSEIVEHMSQSSRALEELLNSLLNLSKLESGTVEVHEQPFNIGFALQRIGHEFRQIGADERLGFEVMFSDQSVYTDPVLVENILRNLLSNAFRYTESGKVSLMCLDEGDHVRVSVMDTGPGIEESEHERIFDEFYQVGNTERNRRKGLGLGLSIVRKTSDLLGVDLSMETAPGVGTKFSLILPKYDGVLEDTTPTDNTMRQTLPQGTRIVVVEDDVEVRLALTNLLKDWGAEVWDVEKVDENTQVDGDVDLIVTDFDLNQTQNGFDAIELLRAQHQRDIPAIILTGNISFEDLDIVQQRELPLIHKPVDGDELFRTIREALGYRPN